MLFRSGLSPTPNVCNPFGPPAPGPLKTIRAALDKIALDPAIYSNPPFTVRIAARWHDGLAAPYVYGLAGPANFSGETFPLLVPPRTLLLADGPNSELDPSSNPIRVILEGPLYAGTPVADTLVFRAGGTDNFTSEGGLDGTEIGAKHGIEVRQGLRTAFLEADENLSSLWLQIPPPVPAPPILPAMSIRMRSVWFSGHQTAYDLDAHVGRSAIGDFEVTDCQFTTDSSVFIDPTSNPPGYPVPHSHHTGQALIHLFSEGASATGLATLRPTFSTDTLTVLPDGGGNLPDVKWGMVIDAQNFSDADLGLTNLAVEGVADPIGQRGIVVGIEFAANTGTTATFSLRGSAVSQCAVFGLAVATGAFVPNTVTELGVSGSRFTGNGVRPGGDFPGQSTHFEWRGAGIHLVRRAAGAPPMGGSTFIGEIASNTITGNRTGIAFSGEGSGTGVPGDLRIAGNTISGQVLFPAGYMPPPGSANQPNGDGVGIILGDDPIPGLVAGGSIASTFLVEANRIFQNARHGVWIAAWNQGSLVYPTLRNNRIYGNGTAAPPPPATYDGVRIEMPNGGAGILLSPTLVVETIVNHPNGYGVNNVAGILSPLSTPRIWNSIVYGNNGTPVPGAGGIDLFGFNFGTADTTSMANGPTVDYSDFCGFPWDPVFFTCGMVHTPPGAPAQHGCISSPPNFVAPAAPNFTPACSGTGALPPTCGCQPPPTGMGSACIDAGNDVGPVDSFGMPLMPQTTDANGSPRIRNLYTEPIPPGTIGEVDMGAVEKQSCIP